MGKIPGIAHQRAVKDRMLLASDWYKDFGPFILCDTDEYLKTVLKKGMKPFGTPL
jgi:hypothetical protein